MTAKEFLTQAFRISDRIASFKRQLETIEGGMRSPNYKSVGGHGGEIVSDTERRGLKAIKLERQLKDEIEHLEAVELAVYNAINALVDINEQLVLRYRYVELGADGKQLSWDVIAYKLRYSRAQTIRLHGKALEHLIF